MCVGGRWGSHLSFSLFCFGREDLLFSHLFWTQWLLFYCLSMWLIATKTVMAPNGVLCFYPSLSSPFTKAFISKFEKSYACMREWIVINSCIRYGLRWTKYQCNKIILLLDLKSPKPLDRIGFSMIESNVVDSNESRVKLGPC